MKEAAKLLEENKIIEAYRVIKNHIANEELSEENFKLRIDDLLVKQKWNKITELYNRNTKVLSSADLNILGIVHANLCLKAKSDEEKKAHFQKALEYYDRALLLDPNNNIFTKNKANTLNNLGTLENDLALKAKSDEEKKVHLQKALEHHDHALLLNPNNDLLIKNKANTLNRLGNLEHDLGLKAKSDEEKKVYLQKALDHFDHALLLNPNNDLLIKNKANILNRLGNLEHDFGLKAKSDEEIKVHFQKALDHFDHALLLNPNSNVFIKNKAPTLNQLGNLKNGLGLKAKLSEEKKAYFQKALEHYDQASLLDHNNIFIKNKAATLNNLGTLEDDLGLKAKLSEEKKAHFQKALEHYNQALLLNPNDSVFIKNKAYTLNQLGNLENSLCSKAKSDQERKAHLQKALEHYDQALLLDHNNDRLIKNKANILNQLGNLEHDLALKAKSDEEKKIHFQKALEHHDQALLLDPNDNIFIENKANTLAYASNNFGNLEYNLGLKAKLFGEKEAYFQKALKHYDQAILLNPNDNIFIKNKANTLAYASNNFGNLEYNLALKAKSHEEKKDHIQKALEHFDHALLLNPNQNILIKNKANILAYASNNFGNLEYNLALKAKSHEEKKDHIQKALEHFDHALLLNPNQNILIKNKANILNQLGNLENILILKAKSDEEKKAHLQKALEHYDQAILLNPNNDLLIKNKAYTLNQLGNLKRIVENNATSTEKPGSDIVEFTSNTSNEKIALGLDMLQAATVKSEKQDDASQRKFAATVKSEKQGSSSQKTLRDSNYESYADTVTKKQKTSQNQHYI